MKNINLYALMVLTAVMLLWFLTSWDVLALLSLLVSTVGLNTTLAIKEQMGSPVLSDVSIEDMAAEFKRRGRHAKTVAVTAETSINDLKRRGYTEVDGVIYPPKV